MFPNNIQFSGEVVINPAHFSILIDFEIVSPTTKQLSNHYVTFVLVTCNILYTLVFVTL